MSDADTAKPKPKNKGLSVTDLYAEAWRQYVHEDNMINKRTGFVIAVQTATFAIAAGVPAYLLNASAGRGWGFAGLALLLGGGVLFGLALFSRCFLLRWEKVTLGGHQYMNLRWATIAAIEKDEGLDRLNLAQQEHKWRKDEQDGTDKEAKFAPFEDILGKGCQNKHKLWRWAGYGGLKFARDMVRLFRKAWLMVGCLGAGLILAGFASGIASLTMMFCYPAGQQTPAP